MMAILQTKLTSKCDENRNPVQRSFLSSIELCETILTSVVIVVIFVGVTCMFLRNEIFITPCGIL